MKKLLTILLLFCAVSSIAQLPITQNLGSDSTLIRIGNNSKGALRGSLIPSTYTDTTQANAGRIDDYPFAIIATSGDGNTWQRNYLATGWVLIGGGSDPSGLFFKVGGNLFPVTVPSRNIGTLAPYGGAIGLMTNSVVHAIVPDAGFTLANDTTAAKVFTWNPTSKEWGYANWNNGGATPTPKYINILLSGQSNAWGASGPTSLDTAANSRVLIWNHAQATPGWVTARINQRPFRTSTYNSVDGGSANPSLAGSTNHTFYYAKKLAEENPNDTIRIIMAIGDGASITDWFSYFTWTKGKYLDSITTRVIASGVPKIDKFIWDQGESNTYQNTGIYFRSFDSIKAVLRGYSWFERNTPITVVGMPRVYMGASITAVGIDTLLQWMDRGDDQFVSYTTTDSLALSNAFNHFDSTGYRTIGMQRLPTAFYTVPHRYSELYQGYLDTLPSGVNYGYTSGTITNNAGLWSLAGSSYGVDTVSVMSGNGVYEVDLPNGSGIYFVGLDSTATPTSYHDGSLYNWPFGWFYNAGSVYAFDGNTSSASYAVSVDTSNIDAIRLIRVQDTVKMQARFKDFYFTIYTYIKKTGVRLYPKVSAYTGSSVVAYPKSTYVATGGSSSSGANTSLPNLHLP